MTLDDVEIVLERMLKDIPEYQSPDLFERALTRRRDLVQTIRGTADNYSRILEEVWAKEAWEKCKGRKQ